MYKNQYKTWALGLALAGVCVSANGTTLLDNNFDGNNGNDVGGTMSDLNNAKPLTVDGIDVSTGVLNFNDAPGGSVAAYGFISDSAFDVSGAPGFTVTWSVSGADTLNTGGIRANGWFFGVQSDNADLWNQNSDALGVTFFTSNYATGARPEDVPALFASSGSTEVGTSLGIPIPTGAELADGFELSLTLNSDDTWSVTSTGLTTEINASGNLGFTALTYADLASSLYVSTILQSDGALQDVQYDQVTLQTVPEPTSLALLALGGLFMSRRRRG